MMFVLALVAMQAESAAPATPADAQVIFNGESHKIAVRYGFTSTDMEFSATLPDGWSFSVAVDGNQDGRWGKGPESDAILPGPTADRKFGMTVHGAYCSQYVLSWFPQDPSQIAASTTCGGFPSNGLVEIGAANPQDEAPLTLKIPIGDIFGDRADAHLQVCLWDTKQTICQYSPAKPLILHRPPG